MCPLFFFFQNNILFSFNYYMSPPMRTRVLLLLACCFLAACGPTTVTSLTKEKGAQQITATDVLALVKGNTLFLHSFNEDSHLFFDPSGRLYGLNAGTDKDSGKWDVSEHGELCMRMDRWWYGDLRCFEVYGSPQKETVYLAGSGGVIQFSAQQQAGDGQHLLAQSGSQKQHRRSIRKQSETTTASSTSAASATMSQTNASSIETAKAPAVTEEQGTGEHDSKDTDATVEWMAKDCPGCKLAGVDLGKADLVGAKLAGADLHGANLSMANLRRADLRGANLRGATLAYANLPGASLQGADLRGAVLKGANLIKADLTGAKLEGADLTEVLRESAKGL